MMQPAQQQMLYEGHPAGEARAVGMGFEIFDPNTGLGTQAGDPPPVNNMEFEILGSDYSQVVEVTVGPGQTVTAEPHTMLYMSGGMAMGADVGDCMQGLKRCCCAGESLFRLHLRNTSPELQKVALTPTFPAKIVPVDLRHHSGLVFNRGAFLGALGTDWRVNIRMAGGLGTAVFGGQGLVMNTLSGSGMVFLAAGGTVRMKQLAPGEQIVVDNHSVLAFASTVQLGVRRAGRGVMVCCCAGQGLFNAVLTGPGFVMTHTMSLNKLRSVMAPGSGGNKGQSNSGGGS